MNEQIPERNFRPIQGLGFLQELHRLIWGISIRIFIETNRGQILGQCGLISYKNSEKNWRKKGEEEMDTDHRRTRGTNRRSWAV